MLAGCSLISSKMLLSSITIILLLMIIVSPTDTKEITERRVIDLVFDNNVTADRNQLILGFSTEFAIQHTEISFDEKCESVVAALKTRKRGDFLLVITDKSKIECDREICKQNFGINLIHQPGNNPSIFYYHFGCQGGAPSNVTGITELVKRVMKRQRLFTPSKIPEEYVGLQEHEGRLQKAIMTLMALMIAALAGILVMKSMNQTKEKKKAHEKEQARKAGKTAPAAAATKMAAKSPVKQDSNKSKKEDPTAKSATKSVKADESGTSAKSQATKTAAADVEKSNKTDRSTKMDQSAAAKEEAAKADAAAKMDQSGKSEK